MPQGPRSRWQLIPVDAPTGALVRVNDLVVTDTFGVKTRIPPQHRHSPTWAVNRLTRSGRLSLTDDFLWLAPALPATHDAPPVEEVLMRRDELANLAWAVEATVPDVFGRPLGLTDAPDTRLRGLARLRPHAELDYRLVPDLPENWAPMVPVRGPDDARMLVLAGLLDEDGLDPPTPRGVLLNAATPLRLHEEELTRAGFTVARHWQLVRWHDGRRAAWIGRLRRPGVGELRSLLEFDTLLTG